MKRNPQFGIRVSLEMPFSDAVGRVKAALAREGFGILTEIDLRKTFREKLGVEFRRYVILGACHPPSAFKAVETNREAGLLLPCNVILFEAEPDRVHVSAMDPVRILEPWEESALAEVAGQVRERLQRVIDSLPA